MALTVNPTVSVSAVTSTGGATPSATTPSATLVLQPGTVVSAQVQNLLAADLVRIVIAGLSLDVVSEVPLQAGQNLQLAVSQTPDGTVRLQVVGQGTASADASDVTSNAPASTVATASAIPVNPNDPLTPLERVAVSVASESAATEQQSLSSLFADLNAATSSASLPPAVQQAVAQVLAQQTSLDPSLSGAAIKTAFQQSGLFLESSLASGSAPAAGGAPDLKAALLVLRQTLATAVETSGGPAAVAPVIASASASETTPTTPSPALVPSQPEQAETAAQPQITSPTTEEAAVSNAVGLLLTEALASVSAKALTSGAALNLLQEALQEIPRAAGNAAAPAMAAQAQGSEGTAPPSSSTAPPPFRGSLPSAQPVASSSIPANASSAATMHRLLDDTDAAIARQTLLQVASLPDRPATAPVDQSTPRWNFEIPFATSQGTAMAQFEISRDGGGNEADPAGRVWRARFSLDVEPAGPVHALITFSGERTSVRMWAERPETAAQLRAGAGELSQALSRAELTPGDIVIREGTPPQPSAAKAGHFLDRAL
jgi:hypothetical protein